MTRILKKYNIIFAVFLFIVMPLLLWAFGHAPIRSVLKESISISIILAFFMVQGQFYLARMNKSLRVHKKNTIVNIHKAVGYACTCVLLLHPFLIVIPRFFEAGVEPLDAFITILSTINSPGVILGICAWCLLLILCMTALLRNKLKIKYTAWRLFHGILSALFIIIAAFHAVNLGRHTDTAMSLYIVLVTAGGLALLANTYVIQIKNGGQIHESW